MAKTGRKQGAVEKESAGPWATCAASQTYCETNNVQIANVVGLKKKEVANVLPFSKGKEKIIKLSDISCTEIIRKRKKTSREENKVRTRLTLADISGCFGLH